MKASESEILQFLEISKNQYFKITSLIILILGDACVEIIDAVVNI